MENRKRALRVALDSSDGQGEAALDDAGAGGAEVRVAGVCVSYDGVFAVCSGCVSASLKSINFSMVGYRLLVR